jgi:hypothetical protein
MKSKALPLSIALFLTSMAVFSQEKSSDTTFNRNVVGIQFNPLRDGDHNYVANLVSVRYGHKLTSHFTIGTELTGCFHKNNMSGFIIDPNLPIASLDHYYELDVNLFMRYTIRPDKMIQGFLEFSPYGKFLFRKPMYYRGLDTFSYFAPGISLVSKNKKFSIDLYYKYSDETFLNEKYGIFSYKLNWHF